MSTNQRPVAFRANGKIIRCTKHTDIELEPIIRDGVRYGEFGYREPDTMVGMNIVALGLKGDPEDGRCEFWVPRDEGGYWYHHYESVEWRGQFGRASRLKTGASEDSCSSTNGWLDSGRTSGRCGARKSDGLRSVGRQVYDPPTYIYNEKRRLSCPRRRFPRKATALTRCRAQHILYHGRTPA